MSNANTINQVCLKLKCFYCPTWFSVTVPENIEMATVCHGCGATNLICAKPAKKANPYLTEPCQQ